MNKMARPMMTVVRFGAEDVIATSAIAPNNTYSAMGKELYQFSIAGNHTTGKTYNAAPGNDLYSFTYDGSDTVYVYGSADDNSYIYAWYNETSGNWLTEGRTAGFYNANGESLPTE